MSLIRTYQLSIMLFLSGMCGILTLVTLMTRTLTPKRQSILAVMEASATLLLLFDRLSYIYRGDPSALGYCMVRISNGLVYFLSLFIPHLLTRYLYDLFVTEGGLSRPPKRMIVCDLLFVAGTVLLVISQFTGLYYTFDAQNTYHRAPGHIFCYIIPMMIVLVQESALLRYREHLSRRFQLTLMVSLALPALASLVQFFTYGLSLTNMTMVLVAILFFLYALNDLNAQLEGARVREIEFYKEAREKEATLFEQTAQALVSAIEAKDKYTHGHSSRVAQYSQQIAREAGWSEADCKMVYYAGLLHDVGKIGVSKEIINKVGRLTDEEFAQIKLHPVLGSQILSSIRQSPYLRIGARYHHERYDGRGYPDGLAGEDIPELARMIAVADAYDAMTSKRSYHNPFSQQRVREELVRGIGTQFDPRYAHIMIDLIDRDRLYQMREDPEAPKGDLQEVLHHLSASD